MDYHNVDSQLDRFNMLMSLAKKVKEQIDKEPAHHEPETEAEEPYFHRMPHISPK